MMTIDPALCIKCGGCVLACPIGLISMEERGPEVHTSKGCMRCMHCTAACPTKAVHFDDVPIQQEYRPIPADPIEQLIRTRRSIRHFKEALPPKETIQWTLDAAEYAPSGHNRHIHRWTVLWGREETDWAAQTIFDWVVKEKYDTPLMDMARQGRNLITCGAPCILICHSAKEKLGAAFAHDGIIAMETVELLLNHRGLGTCWAGYFQRLAEMVPAVKERLALPEGHAICCALMVGYPDGEQYHNIPYRPQAKPDWIERS